MKKVFNLLVLAFFTASVTIFFSCKKELEIPPGEITTPEVPTLSTLTVSMITATSASTGGIVTTSGGAEVTVCGVCWSTTNSPTVSNNRTIGGMGSGTFSSIITGLSQNTTYYVRAYATNRAGTAYGNQVTLNTNLMPVISTITLTTTTVTEIKAGSAVSGGNIITDGGNPVTSRGICWGTDPNPTINNIKNSDGSGLGSFISNLAWLDPGTTYFVRTYAVNSAGVAYGNQLSFTTSLSQDPWTRKADFPGGLRYGSASFSIGTKAYLGIGFNDGDWPTRDFWEWDQMTNVWTRKADYPGKIEGNAVSFSIGTKGYIGTGDDFNTNGYTNEFWEYDPATNRWTQKASLPGTPGRGSAAGFSIGNKGYIGIGSAWEPGWPVSFYHHDLWEWDQLTDVWTKKADYPGNSTVGAVGFSIGNKGYFGTGGDGTSYSKEFWEWDQATNVWTKKADFGGSARAWSVGFSISNKGYIGTGVGDGGTLNNDFWEWDQAINNWRQAVNFGGMARTVAVGFSIGNKGYVGTGVTGVDPNYALQDFWVYDPTFK